MKRTKDQAIHIGARLEDRFHSYRMNAASKRGGVQTVLPFTGYGSDSWVRVLGRVVLAKPGKLSAPASGSVQALRDGVRGWRNFISPPVNDAVVCVRIGDEKHLVTADRGGVVDVVLPASLAPGWQTVSLLPEAEPDAEPVLSPVYIVDPAARTGVISDIDDTIMVTALPRPLLAAWNTFVLDEHARTPTPGMAVLMDRLVRRTKALRSSTCPRGRGTSPRRSPGSSPGTCIRLVRCCSRTGALPATAGSAAAPSTSAPSWNAWRRSFRTSAGC